MDRNTAFTGSIPENYDHYLGPALFEPYAADLAARVRVSNEDSLLEVACGTGILTRKLRDTLPATVKLVATDLNEPMIEFAAKKFRNDEAVIFRQADAVNLPFADQAFGGVVCQFGLMFVPDKERALAETYRVLGAGGSFVFNVWDALEFNDAAHIAHKTISKFFEDDPPTFYEVPFSLHDRDKIMSLVKDAGFRNVQMSVLQFPSISPSAKQFAKGLVEGNPVITAIHERGSANVEEIESAVAAAIVSRCGDNPVSAHTRALVCECVC